MLAACCDDDEEDVGARKFNNNMPVAANQAVISDDQLDMMKIGDGLSQKIILQISCSDLPNMDVKSKSDPFAVRDIFCKGD